MAQGLQNVLEELRIMETYYEPENAVLFESDLNDQIGHETVREAINDGILEHRRLPFTGAWGDGRERCICWLTPKGRALADS